MAKIVDVTDVPDMPGAGMLHFDDGRPPMMALPDIANEWRERIGAQSDRRIADNGKSLVPGAVDVEDNGAMARDLGKAWDATKKFLTTPIGHASNAGTVNHAPAPAAPPPSVDASSPEGQRVWAQFGPAVQPSPAPAPQPSAPPPSIARPPESPEQAQPPAATSLVDQANEAIRNRAADEILNGRLVPGGPAHPAGYVPTTRSIKTEGGAPYDTEMAGQRIDADRSLLDAQLYQAKTQQDIARADAARAQTANITATRQAAGAQAALQQKQADFQQQQNYMQQELQAYSQEAQPDPDRFFKQRSTVSNVMSAIGQALGAAGAVLGHTQNFAFEYVQNQIRNDIAAQETAYNAGRADRRDALARFVNYYNGDIDLAKNALAIAMNKVASTEAQQFAAQSQSQQIGANAQVLAAQFERDSLKREQDMYNASIGKVETSTSEKYQQASSGAPMRKPLTDAEIAARAKLIKPGKDQGALGLSARAVATQKAAYGAKKEQIERFRSSLDEEAKLSGVKIDWDTGTVMNPETGRPARELPESPGVGYLAGKLPDSLAGQEGRALRRARANSARLHAQAIYDKSITADEAEHEIPSIMGTTPADALMSLKQRVHELSQYDYQLDTSAASIDPRFVNERKQAQKDVSYSRATKTPLAEPGARAGAAEDEPTNEGEP